MFRLKRKIVLKISVIAAMFLICVLGELFIFNFSYWRIPTEQKGLYTIESPQISLNDIEEKEGVLFVTGANPYFTINTSKYISYLKGNFSLFEDKGSFYMYTNQSSSVEPKKYLIENGIKTEAILKIEDMAQNVKFFIQAEEGLKGFSINQIIVDNHFCFNWLRVWLIFSIALLGIFFVYHRKIAGEKLHVTFIVILLLIGSNISILTPSYFSYDEREHFIRAYEISRNDFGVFGEKDIPWIKNADHFFAFNGKSITHDNYKERLNYTETFATKDYSHAANYGSTAVTYPFVPYFISGVGIFVARKLGLPFIYTFYAGRLASLFAYALICFFAIKYAKIAKRLIFMIALLPAMAYVVGAYSADTMTLAFSIAAITVFLNMLAKKEKEIDYKMPLLFLSCLCIVIMSKVPYAPLCLLILSVKNNKFKTKRQAIVFKGIVLSLSGIVAVLTYLYATMKDLNQWGMPGVDVSKQIAFILHNPFEYIGIMWNSFASNIFLYFSGITTSLAYSGNLKVIYLFIIVIALFVIATIDNESDTLQIKIRDKFFLLSSFVLSWALVMTSLYISFTPVSANYIAGVQGRYIAPLILPMLLLFKNNKVIPNFKKENLNVILGAGCSFMLVLTATILLNSFNS